MHTSRAHTAQHSSNDAHSYASTRSGDPPERRDGPPPDDPPSTSAAAQTADTPHDTLLAAALAYTTLGWPVFPCRPGGKVPYPRTNGVHDATVNHAVIRDWAARRPTPNLAIACGAPGPDVVDVDVKAGQPGIFTMRRLQRAGLLVGACLLVGTPSGGWHLYFRGGVQRNGSLPDHGVDFRSAGGYVIAPPSTIDGRAYLLRDARIPRATVDFTRIRRFLEPPRVSRNQDPRSASAGGDWAGMVAHVARQQENNRNRCLYWAACSAAKEGAPEDTFDALVDAAVSTGLTERASRATVASAYRRYGGAS